MFCKQCGAKNPDGAAFCRKCGSHLDKIQREPIKTVPKISTNTQQGGTKRKRPILTTRKTSKVYLISQLVGDILFGGGLSGYLLMRGVELCESFWYRSEGEKLISIGFVFFFLSALAACYHIIVSRTYADIYENRFSGSGMQGVQYKSFDLRSEKIEGVSISRGFLNLESSGGVFLVINTAAGNYKIITTEARAKEILNYYSGDENQ